MRMDVTGMIIKDEAFTKESFKLERDKLGVLATKPKPKDLTKYYEFEDYISHKESSNSLVDIGYDLVKSLMFNTKLKILKRNQPDIKSVLDYGCGTGEFVSYLSKKGIISSGVEPTKKAFDQAEKAEVKIYKNLKKVEGTFDAITLFHVLEHVEDYLKVLEDLKAKLNPGGLLVIAVPNYKSYDASYYKEKWAAWDVPRHLWHFKKQDLSTIAHLLNLEIVQIKPMFFDAYYISMISESYKGNHKLKGLYRGWESNQQAKKSGEYSSNIFVMKTSK
ncbi:SAM-dependent methyltransferase, AdoMet_MTases superfamily [Psychroflexus torquis ATCC 700755]|uniref:SAM-dependent methyltransferase, AdoMet_MTases superfamily n=1 Tax=Psychroflexus torquis (strain ATCC 700755 / CIP 106069 / ACAM 623) TaxID=313595 RepID=K4II13_PSYTT|nr:class I SAM-dependent methyltransferase [Psychroflexus torquis]AFU68716.1 SAM-dependent methyltransferase, AdoMet_MTases superfamily [Psychroflexus torquis ATCC 700755]